MIRSFFGIDKNPFGMEDIKLLDNQQDIYDILKVHSQQGGLCLLMGEPGTGKTIIKELIKQNVVCSWALTPKLQRQSTAA